MKKIKSYLTLVATFTRTPIQKVNVNDIENTSDRENIENQQEQSEELLTNIGESSSNDKQQEQMDDEEIIHKELNTFYLSSGTHDIVASTNLDEWFENNVVSSIMASIDRFQENGSGWALQEIIQMDIVYNKCSNFNASSYIKLPKRISNKHAIIVNVKNYDNKCFLWSVLSALHPTNQNADRVTKYKAFENTLNMDEIEYPVSLSDIDTFEKNNPLISINVYVFDKQFDLNLQEFDIMIVPIRLTKCVKEKHIHLLLLYDNLKFFKNENEFDFYQHSEFINMSVLLENDLGDKSLGNSVMKSINIIVGSKI